jgi:hypothetical protein
MSVQVEFPDELLVATREEPDVFSRQVMIFTLGQLYSRGRISSGVAAHVLGCDRLEFYQLLSEYGFSVIDYAPAELNDEVISSRTLAERITPP